MFLVGVVAYLKINELCPYETDGECVNFFLIPNVQKWVTLAITSSVCFVGVLVLAQKRLISRYAMVAVAAVLFYFIVW